MKGPTLVAAKTGVTITAQAPIKHRCPFVDEADEGTIALVWTTGNCTLELHSLATFLGQYAKQEISHEDLVDDVFYGLDLLHPQIRVRSVTAHFTTAGIDVEVRRGPVHVDAVGT